MFTSECSGSVNTNVATGIFLKKETGIVRVRERSEDATLLALKMKEGAMTKKCRWLLEATKGKEARAYRRNIALPKP